VFRQGITRAEVYDTTPATAPKEIFELIKGDNVLRLPKVAKLHSARGTMKGEVQDRVVVVLGLQPLDHVDVEFLACGYVVVNIRRVIRRQLV
jgi:hypothetical protein